jgi:hypothetical protein
VADHPTAGSSQQQQQQHNSSDDAVGVKQVVQDNGGNLPPDIANGFRS